MITKNKILNLVFLVLLNISFSYCIGCIEGNCYSGSGLLIYPNGEIYSGEFKDGLRHGFGTHYYGPNLNEKRNFDLKKELRPAVSMDKNSFGKYEGEWEDDMKWGFGKYTFPNEQYFLGEYKRDKRRGIGMLVFADKTYKYIGEFRMSEKDGWGIVHTIIPSSNDSKDRLVSSSSNQYFFTNDSLNIIDGGAYYKEEKLFNESLDSVIIKLFKKYPDRAIILQQLRIYNEKLVDSLFNNKFITMNCGQFYGGAYTDCPFGWECIDGNCFNPKISNTVNENLECPSGLYDCFGLCDGSAIIDECGICGGEGILEGYCDCSGSILDCNGDCDGTAITDDCGNCCGGAGSLADLQCSWFEFPGVGLIDECGMCNGPGYNEDGCCGTQIQDCAGECGGLSTIDECGMCNGPGYNEDGCCGLEIRDCTGNCGGLSIMDECGVCNGSGYNKVGCCGLETRDCTGECGGLSIIDECGICNGNGFAVCENGDQVCLLEDCKEKGCDLPENSIKLVNNQVLYNSKNSIYGFEIKMQKSLINKIYNSDKENQVFITNIMGSNAMGRTIDSFGLDPGCGILFEVDLVSSFYGIKSFTIYNKFGIPEQLKVIN